MLTPKAKAKATGAKSPKALSAKLKAASKKAAKATAQVSMKSRGVPGQAKDKKGGLSGLVSYRWI